MNAIHYIMHVLQNTEVRDVCIIFKIIMTIFYIIIFVAF